MCIAELEIYAKIASKYVLTMKEENKHPLFYELLGGAHTRGTYRPVLTYPIQRLTESRVNEDPTFDIEREGNERELIGNFARMYSALHYLHVTVGVMHCNVSLEALYFDVRNQFRLGDLQNCQNIAETTAKFAGLRINPKLIPNGYETVEILTAKNNQYDTILTTVESDFYALLVAFIFLITRIHPFLDALGNRKTHGPELSASNSKFVKLLHKLLKSPSLLSVDVLLKSKERSFTRHKKPFVDDLVTVFGQIGLDRFTRDTSPRTKYSRKKKRCSDNSDDTYLTSKRMPSSYHQLESNSVADDSELNGESDQQDSCQFNDGLSLSSDSEEPTAARCGASSKTDDLDDIVAEHLDSYKEVSSLQTPRPLIPDEPVFICPGPVFRRHGGRNTVAYGDARNSHCNLAETTQADEGLCSSTYDYPTNEYVAPELAATENVSLAPHLLEAARGHAEEYSDMTQCNEMLNQVSVISDTPGNFVNQIGGDILEEAIAQVRNCPSESHEAHLSALNEPDDVFRTSSSARVENELQSPAADVPPANVSNAGSQNGSSGLRCLLSALPTSSLLAPEVAQKVELEYELHPDGSIVVVRHAVSRLH
ncbi:hypothetical protein HDE_12939 [Halotydeus destructor]|nr:hypothetical protein HDE_12939 [Halotydeus destructor]